jgi:BirA family transcriptional regulator, biotin operon repressor / biotin---[acetyl-CoA-carboxylase] ligase
MSRAALVTQRQLLQLLSKGEFISGQMVADELGLSRTAIANHIKLLQELGLDIYKVKGKGYRLAQPLNLLDAAVIIKLKAVGLPDVLVQSITDSTNSQLMQKVADGTIKTPGYVIVAEAQTAGRGRRGRVWYSPFGSSLYFSMYWRLEQGVQAAMGLSLIVAMALSRLLEREYQLAPTVKWPNDVYIDGKKLAGILVELAGQADAACDVIIGIGLNVQLPQQSHSYIDQSYTDLCSSIELPIDRNKLIVNLQTELITMLRKFSEQGFADFAAEFNRRDHFHMQPVKLSGSTDCSGICLGVDKQGALLIKTASGSQTFFGGELSLRAGD